MDFEAMQKIWSEQTPGRVELPARAELSERIGKDNRAFDAMIAARDRAELRTGFTLVAVFAGVGATYGRSTGVAWPFFAAAVCMLWVCAFFIVEKRLARRRELKNSEPLLAVLEAATVHVERQLWLLRNVTWWYLLPAQSGWFLFFLGVLLTTGIPVWAMLAALPLLCWYLWRGSVTVYLLNRAAVTNDLEPRYEELKRLREALVPTANQDDAGGADAGASRGAG